jgi:prefoldin beta subunit
MNISKEDQQKVQELQLLDQNLQAMLMQKQNFQAQLMEVESAMEELAKTSKAYKIIGNIMIDSSKDDLKKDLDSKKEILSLRIKTIQSQEDKLKEKAADLQKEVLNKIKNAGTNK